MIYRDLGSLTIVQIPLVRLKEISTFLNKPKLCKQKEFGYKASIFIKKFL